MTTEHGEHARRYNLGGHARFLTFSCFQRRSFLASDRTRGWLLESIERSRTTHGFRLWAWVFMPDHVHLLIWPRNDAPDVGPILASIKIPVSRRTVSWVRKHAAHYLPTMSDVAPNGRVAYRFWQRGYGYDRNLWTPKRISTAIEYIHENPVRRGLCERATQWTWSSAREFETPGVGPLSIDRHTIPPLP